LTANHLQSHAQTQAVRALRDLVGQTMRAGVGRRAAMLHLDRLPPALAKAHHQRLARTAMMALADRDHAQSFDLPHGRLAIVWRSRGPDEVAEPMAALKHLLADLPEGQEVPLGQLVSLFDLPAHAPWLLDTLGPVDPVAHAGALPGLDAALLARLEDTLAQADIAQFLRWRPVMDIERPTPVLAYEERGLSWPDLAATICPGRTPNDGSWLARRLSRLTDRRVLAAMTGPRDLAGTRPFAIELAIASILSPAFLAFDAALPAGLRGHVILRLDAADILADPASFCFARNFAQAKSYRLLLRDAAPGLLDPHAAGLDLLELALTQDHRANPATLPDRATLVLDGIDDATTLAWARAQGCVMVKGQAALG
jgi:hypothetical protein